MHLRASITSVLLATALAAQTQVIPASFASTGAASSTSFPFGLNTACRIQYLYGAQETGLSGPVVIRSINVRGNETSTNPAKSNIDLQITLSTTNVTVGTATGVFASNHGANALVAYMRKPTALNATTPANPGQYGGALPLDFPFLYDPAAGNLLVDFDVASQPTGAWTMDTPFTTAGTHTSIGVGCGGMSATSIGGALGGPVTYSLSGGQPNGVGVLLIGFNLFPVPIPIPGSPFCNLYQDFPALNVVTLNPAGACSVPLNVPADATLRNGNVYGQFADVNATLGIDTSNSRQVTLLSWVVLRVNNTTSNQGNGSVQNYVGIVLELGF